MYRTRGAQGSLFVNWLGKRFLVSCAHAEARQTKKKGCGICFGAASAHRRLPSPGVLHFCLPGLGRVAGWRRSGCGPESDCDKVLTSRWAYLFGVPISYFALQFISAASSCFSRSRFQPSLFGVALIILISAVWFIGLQLVAIRAFCKFCLTAHLAGGVAAMLLLRQTKLERKSAMPVLAAAGFASALLIVAQTLSAPRGPVVIATAPSSPASNQVITAPPPNVATQIVAAPPELPSSFAILDGQFTLDLKTVPVTGPLNAPKKIVKLFDYTCHHCRDTHHALEPVRTVILTTSQLFHSRFRSNPVAIPREKNPQRASRSLRTHKDCARRFSFRSFEIRRVLKLAFRPRNTTFHFRLSRSCRPPRGRGPPEHRPGR